MTLTSDYKLLLMADYNSVTAPSALGCWTMADEAERGAMQEDTPATTTSAPAVSVPVPVGGASQESVDEPSAPPAAISGANSPTGAAIADLVAAEGTLASPEPPRESTTAEEREPDEEPPSKRPRLVDGENDTQTAPLMQEEPPKDSDMPDAVPTLGAEATAPSEPPTRATDDPDPQPERTAASQAIPTDAAPSEPAEQDKEEDPAADRPETAQEESAATATSAPSHTLNLPADTSGPPTEDTAVVTTGPSIAAESTEGEPAGEDSQPLEPIPEPALLATAPSPDNADLPPSGAEPLPRASNPAPSAATAADSKRAAAPAAAAPPPAAETPVAPAPLSDARPEAGPAASKNTESAVIDAGPSTEAGVPVQAVDSASAPSAPSPPAAATALTTAPPTEGAVPVPGPDTAQPPATETAPTSAPVAADVTPATIAESYTTAAPPPQPEPSSASAAAPPPPPQVDFFTVPDSEAYRAAHSASQWNSLLGWARTARLESAPGGAERGWDFGTGM